MPTPIDDGANFPTAPSLPTESEAGEAILYTPAAPIIKKEDEGVNFPAVPAQGEAGNAVQEHIMPTTPIKTEDYDADKEENFHAPRPSRDREKRRRVDDGDAVDGAGNHDWVDDGGENGKRSPSVRECGNVEHQRGEQDGEYPSSANGGTILACGRVDDGGVQSAKPPSAHGTAIGGGAGAASIIRRVCPRWERRGQCGSCPARRLRYIRWQYCILLSKLQVSKCCIQVKSSSVILKGRY